eukprot:scaffold16277_cov57-Phaeocystis_antarctica.AAC.8
MQHVACGGGHSNPDPNPNPNLTLTLTLTLTSPSSAIHHPRCGGGHSAAVTSSGDAYCCGSNACGQLGLGLSPGTR